MNRLTATQTLFRTSLVLTLLLISPFNSVSAEDAFFDALKGGKFDFSANYRFEHVDDNLALNQANASTIRSTLGYKTGMFHDFDARLLIQDVRTVGIDDYNDATGRPNAKTQYAVVADPQDTDYIEGYIGYSGLPNTVIKAGRQLITYRDAPFHRFIGTVLWRQNWQNHDAVTLTNTSLPDTTFHYAYIWNVNRIFTDEAVGALANFESNSHLFNIQYSKYPFAKLEGYAYLLDFDNAPAFSTNTYGGRISGGYPLSNQFKAIYAGEYARQTDAANNPGNYDVNYWLGEIGGSVAFSGPVNAVTVKFSYEQLEGNGTSAFNTILGTNHAYQGWADRFLITPANGIEDYYVTAIVKALGATFIAAYHDLNSDNLGFDYGEEIDLLVTKTFMEHYTVGLKYADYQADSNINNVGATAADVAKIWAWVSVKF